LGFSFYKTGGLWQIRAADKSVKRIKEKMKAMLPRNSAQQVEAKMVRLDAIIRGWVQYFQLGAIKSICKRLDELLRSRVRKLYWQKWQKTKTRLRNLVKLGVPQWRAYQWSNTSKGASRTAHSPILQQSLSNEVLLKLGLPSFYQRYHNKVEIQLNLF